jgi:hypothetical protein
MAKNRARRQKSTPSWHNECTQRGVFGRNSANRQVFGHMQISVRRGKMENGEKGKDGSILAC